MAARALVLLTASLLLGSAQASERFSLRYPGWTLYLEMHQSRVPSPGQHDAPASHSLSIRVPGNSLPETSWRLPLKDSAFLSFDATFTASHANPALPEAVRPKFQAGFGLGVEF